MEQSSDNTNLQDILNSIDINKINNVVKKRGRPRKLISDNN